MEEGARAMRTLVRLVEIVEIVEIVQIVAMARDDHVLRRRFHSFLLLKLVVLRRSGGGVAPSPSANTSWPTRPLPPFRLA